MNTLLKQTEASASMERSDLEGMIGESVQRIFADHVSPTLLNRAEAGEWPADLWQLIEDNGLSLALCRGEEGGTDARWPDVYPILAGIGRWSVPLPLAETMIAAWLLSQAAVAVPSGPITIAANGNVSCAPGGVLTGMLRGVPWASRCGWLLVAVSAGTGASKLALLDLSSAALSIRPGLNMAGEPRDDILLDAAPATVFFDNPVPRLDDPLRLLGALVRCTMLVGALERTLELSIQYTNERVQFGKPLSKNQVIQHGLASVAGETVAAKVATRVAVFSLMPEQAGRTTAFDVAVAKVRCGQAAARLAAVAHQFHGAIGFTHEHVLHHSTRRLWSWRNEFGSDATWAAALGRAAMSKGAAGFWPAMTDRSLSLSSLASL